MKNARKENQKLFFEIIRRNVKQINVKIVNNIKDKYDEVIREECQQPKRNRKKYNKVQEESAEYLIDSLLF